VRRAGADHTNAARAYMHTKSRLIPLWSTIGV
jgi:hypothetical protein